ncbi:hypothetical protein [Dongshaea marina]|uniref:hypothetical protein n=1 Tax=Dongshaea marina TaxID=2047966 RepID=UPI000D3E467F|nr:hypothetical protein [Dongshaea marina]
MEQQRIIGPFQLILIIVILTVATLLLSPHIQNSKTMTHRELLFELQDELHYQVNRIKQLSIAEGKSQDVYALLEFQGRLIEIHYGLPGYDSLLKLAKGYGQGYWQVNRERRQVIFSPKHPVMAMTDHCHLIYQLTPDRKQYQILLDVKGC